MIPENKLIKSEIVLRELALPDDVLIARKSIIRWLALSLGLIAPNESRTLLLDLLDVLLDFQIKGRAPSTREIIEALKKKTGKENPKAVYYHLQRLISIGLLTRKKGRYFFGDREDEEIDNVIREFLRRKIDTVLNGVEIALKRLKDR